jgi:hypothetical protein
MDPFDRMIFVDAFTYDFDGVKETGVFEVPPGKDSLYSCDVLNWPDAKRIINRYAKQYGKNLKQINFGMMEGSEKTGFIMNYFFGAIVAHR